MNDSNIIGRSDSVRRKIDQNDIATICHEVLLKEEVGNDFSFLIWGEIIHNFAVCNKDREWNEKEVVQKFCDANEEKLLSEKRKCK